jgi:dihydrofolate reductase
MRKLIMFNLMTLDALFAGPDGNIDWHNVDDEFNRFADEQTGQFGGLLFGRVTYELMASYWPTAEAKRDDPIVAEAMNRLPKFVFSRTLDKVGWENSTLIKNDAEAAVKKLKSESGHPLAVFGSANFASSILPLIDEFRILINPVILGIGKPLFPNVKTPLKLGLTSSRTFKSGNVLLTYQPQR